MDSPNNKLQDANPVVKERDGVSNEGMDNSQAFPSIKHHSKGQALFLNFSSDLSPQKMNKAPKKCKRQAAYRVNGVNILNRNNLDSKTVIERIQKRRENHNHVERRRRDNINSTILELSQIVPDALQPNQKPNKGNILKLTLDYVKKLQADNLSLKSRHVPSSYFSGNMIEAENNGDCSHKNVRSAPSSPVITSKPRTTVDTELQQTIQSLSLPSSPMHHHHYSHYCPQHCRKDDPQRLDMHQPNVNSSQPLPQNMMESVNSNYITPISDSPATRIIDQHRLAPNPQTISHHQPHSRYIHHPTLRPLLPASSSPFTSQTSPSYTTQARMTGTEKMYSSVCRY